MRLNFRIRLTSPLLGYIQTHEPVTQFVIEKNALCLDLEEIAWRLENASTSVQLGQVVNATSVRFPDKITVPTLGTYIKQWRVKGTGARKRREFQCIREGALVSIPLRSVTEPDPPEIVRVPSIAEMRIALDEMGQFYGLMGWGSELGFGRFVVDELSEDTTPLST